MQLFEVVEIHFFLFSFFNVYQDVMIIMPSCDAWGTQIITEAVNGKSKKKFSGASFALLFLGANSFSPVNDPWKGKKVKIILSFQSWS